MEDSCVVFSVGSVVVVIVVVLVVPIILVLPIITIKFILGYFTNYITFVNHCFMTNTFPSN